MVVGAYMIKEKMKTNSVFKLYADTVLEEKKMYKKPYSCYDLIFLNRRIFHYIIMTYGSH